MARTSRLKQERVVEAVRLGLEGDEALSFIHQSGFALTGAGVARHLKALGGRGKVLAAIAEGLTNREILERVFPGDDLDEVPVHEPEQPELFKAEKRDDEDGLADPPGGGFEHTKLTLTLPTDLYQAISLAARAEKKSRADLIIEVLTAQLSLLPMYPGEES
ncbi:MAG: hypothetical protein GC168_21490 [Candidatus Hydrogenedens sp.]|nr:hypothetical protein [Candidatus Hydrogenedens sp.]